ncbi:hypothetical protein JTB14_002828 [Gonioctena quinquepunctata]|nr:hypothetical protein JTB14_002828 [Gonioctena quinquepunctata]
MNPAASGGPARACLNDQESGLRTSPVYGEMGGMSERRTYTALDMRIAQFKNDPEKMKEVNDFLNEILEKAKKEAEKRNGKQRSKLDLLGIQNGTKKIGVWSNRARTSARTFASRIFTTLCNCTNSVKTTLSSRNNNN